MHFVDAKGIVTGKDGYYGMNIYRGCTHGCIYCDSRSKCYRFTHAFEDIEVKRNAPQLLEQALRDVPDTKFVGHSQCFWIEISAQVPPGKEGRQSYGVGPVVPGGRVPELLDKYPNLYGDLSANSAGKAIMRDPEFGLAFLEKYAGRLFFATDMTSAARVYPLGGWLDEMARTGALSRYAYEQICWRNAQRVYGLTI